MYPVGKPKLRVLVAATAAPEADFELVADLPADDADSVGPDGTGLTHTWKGNPVAIATVAGDVIRPRFHIGNYDLFSDRACRG